MPIKSFKYSDLDNDWHLEKTSFSNFNLLVGASGVGKSKILQALADLRTFSRGGSLPLSGLEWCLEISANSNLYMWEGKTSVAPVDPDSSRSMGLGHRHNLVSLFTNEKITKNDSEVLVERSEGKCFFRDKEIPNLKAHRSLLTYFSEDADLSALERALSRFSFDFEEEFPQPRLGWGEDLKVDLSSLQESARVESLNQLRNLGGFPLLAKAYLFQRKFPEEYSQLVESFKEMFPSVESVVVDDLYKLLPEHLFPPDQKTTYLTVGLHERGVENLLTGLSEGMLKSLAHLFQLWLSPPGTVIFIDEIENSLGPNCLPELLDHFMDRASDLQFILTSHHPWIINNVPKEYWKIVTREKGRVSVSDASEFPRLNTTSALDKFILLQNLEEYSEGIR